MLDDPPVELRSRAVDEQPGKENIGQKMGALGNAPEPDDCSYYEHGGDSTAPQTSRGR